MATLIRSRWTSSFEGMSRRDRQGCDYDAYLPDPLAGWELTLPADLIADLGRSEMRTGEAVNRLEAAGVLRQRNVGRQRYRVFEAADVVDLFTGLERALASPTGDMVTAPPTRRVPRRANSADNA